MSDQAQTNQSAAKGVPSPVNSDGTTNWAEVFDNPQLGILAAVAGAKSPAQLRAIMVNVAKLLYKRKHDAGPRATFLATVEATIGPDADSDFEAARARVRSMLVDEKNLRIQKAEQYSKNKLLAQSLERRRSGIRESLFGSPLRIVIVAGVLLSLLIGTAAFLIYDGDEGEQGTSQSESAPAQEAPAPAAQQPPAEKKIEKPAAERPASPPVTQNRMLALKPINIRANIDGKARDLALVPLIGLPNDGDRTDLCTLTPRIREAVTFGMRAALDIGIPYAPALLADVAAKVRADIKRTADVQLPSFQLRDSRDVSQKVLLASYKGCSQVNVDPM